MPATRSRPGRIWRSSRRGPALTLVTIAGIGAGVALYLQGAGTRAEVDDRVGIVDHWTFGRSADHPGALEQPATIDERVTVSGPDGNVFEAYWRARACDDAPRVTVMGSREEIRLLVRLRQSEARNGCEPIGDVFRLTVVTNRPLAVGSVTGQFARDE